MSISVQCPSCSKNIRAKDELAGKRVKCPGCGQTVLVPAAKPASGLQSNKQTQDQLVDTQKTKPTTTLPSTKQTVLREGLQVLHKKNGTPTTLFVPERCDAFGVKDQELLKTLLTSLRIHSWVNVKVGDVPLRIVSAVMPLPIASPQFEGEPLMPLRHPAITFPPGDFFSQYHIVCNSENDTTPKKFLNHGLYFSTQMADANIVCFSRKIYVIPNASIDTFFANLVERGVEAFQGFDSFDDPTADLTDAHGLIAERGSKRNSKAGLAPIRSTPLADEHTPSATKDGFQVPTEIQNALFRFGAGLFMFLFGGIVVFLFGVAYCEKGALEIQYAGYLIFIWIPMTALGGYLVCTTPLRKMRNTITALQHAHNNEQAALAQKERPGKGKAAEPAAKPAQPGFTSQLLSVADIQRNDQEMGEIYLHCPKCGEDERINDMGKMMLKQGNNVFANYKCKKCGVAFDGAKHNVNRNP